MKLNGTYLLPFLRITMIISIRRSYSLMMDERNCVSIADKKRFEICFVPFCACELMSWKPVGEESFRPSTTFATTPVETILREMRG